LLIAQGARNTAATLASFEVRAFCEYLLNCRAGRFADDGIIGDCVARGAYLSPFASSRKADNLFDCQRGPVHGAFADPMHAIVSMDCAP
jgi:hypothetical protein